MVAGREGSRRASVKRPERSEIQPFAANWAGQITSPLMTSASASSAWNSMRSFSKYWLVSAGARSCVTSRAPLLRSLKRRIWRLSTSESSQCEKTSLTRPWLSWPAQPATPRRARPRRARESAGGSRGVSLARLLRPSSPEGEVEGGALADLALGPHHAPVALHDALDRREPYAGALEVLRRVQALERAEELGRVGHVEPDPVVANVVDRAPVRDAELHDGVPLLLGELERVAQQVLERDPQQAGIGVRRETIGDHELHLPTWPRLPELGGDLARDGAQVDA